MTPNRREFLEIAGAGLLAGYAGWSGGHSRARVRPSGSADSVLVKLSSKSSVERSVPAERSATR